MTNRVREQLTPRCKRRRVAADFSGGNVTSDAGLLLVRQADPRWLCHGWVLEAKPGRFRETRENLEPRRGPAGVAREASGR